MPPNSDIAGKRRARRSTTRRTKRAALRAPVSLNRRRRLAPRVHLGRRRLELEPDEGFVTNHPGIVARLDDVRLPRPNLSLGAVLVRHVNPAGLNDANMPHLARFGPH